MLFLSHWFTTFCWDYEGYMLLRLNPLKLVSGLVFFCFFHPMVIGFLAKLNSNRRNRIDFQKLREEHSGGRKGPILLCNTRTREIDKKKTGIFIIILGRALKEQIFFFWGVIVILQISVNLVPYLFIYLCSYEFR